MPENNWNERFTKAAANKPDRFQTAEIEFGDDSAPADQKSSPVQKLYDFYSSPQGGKPVVPAAGQSAPRGVERAVYSYELEGGVLLNCRIEQWGKGFTLFGDFVRDAKKYYKKTCINANYVYFFSYRPMYRELSHEQLCWYLFWRSRVREGTYLKTGLSYIFLYLYEQINLSDVIGCEKVYENIVKIWKNYRGEFPRIDKYIAEWLTDFALVNKVSVNLDDFEDILAHIVNIVAVPEFYIGGNFFKNPKNTGLIITGMSVYDYKKSKFYDEKNMELFDFHIAQMLRAVLSSAPFEEIVKKETGDSVKIKTTRESYMGAVCAYEHKKKITVEYKNLYKNFFLRQCVTDSVRYAENVLRDYLNIKSKLTVSALPGELKKIADGYKEKYLPGVRSPKMTGKTKNAEKGVPEMFEPVEFNPDIISAAEIEKSSWDTTMTLVGLQNRDSISEITEDDTEYTADDADFTEIDFDSGEGDFIPINTGTNEDIFDILDNLETEEPEEITGMAGFAGNLCREESAVLKMLLGAKAKNKSFEDLCAGFLNENGGMLESVVDAINEKAMDFTGDIVFDTAAGEIIEDYREDIERCLKKI